LHDRNDGVRTLTPPCLFLSFLTGPANEHHQSLSRVRSLSLPSPVLKDEVKQDGDHDEPDPLSCDQKNVSDAQAVQDPEKGCALNKEEHGKRKVIGALSLPEQPYLRNDPELDHKRKAHSDRARRISKAHCNLPK
jgi:hypothetical protein